MFDDGGAPLPLDAPGRLDDVALQDLLRKRDGLPPGDVPGDAPNDPDLHNFLDQLMRDEVAAGGGGHLDADPGVSAGGPLSSSFFREIGDLGIPSVGGTASPPPARRGGSLAAAPSAAPQPKPKARDAPPSEGDDPLGGSEIRVSKLRDLEASGEAIRAQAANRRPQALSFRAAAAKRAADVNVASEAKDGSHQGSGGDGSGQGSAGLRSGGSRSPVGSAEMDDHAPGPRGGAPEEEEDESPSTSAALAGMDYVRLLGAALRKSREQQSEVGADPGAVPDLSDPPEVLIRRVAKMLDHLSTELQYGSLIQLYLPTTRADTGDVSLVTHKDFSRVNTVHEEKFWRYHEQSCAFFFNASPLSEDGLMGMPGRVFLGRRPEWTPSVCCYQPFEYPRLACAIESRVHTLLAIPVFLGDRDGDAKNDPPSSSDPSETQMPIGIMEFMMDHQTMLIGSVFESAAAMLEKHGFRTVGFDELAPPPRMRATLGDTLDAIDAKRAESVLREMTDSFRLPLAQCWVACPAGSSGRGAAAAAAASPRLVASGAPYSVGETAALPFRHMCEQVGLGADVQGPAARAFASGEMVWVDDVTKGSQLEWPLHHPAMLVGFRGACATSVWLDAAASSAAKVHATLEVFLPADLEGEEAQREMVEKIRAFIERRLSLGAVDPGGDPGDWGNAEGAASRGRSPLGVTLDQLRVHFDKHLKDAARDLGVGSTTLKRICRRFGINRWPRRSLKSNQQRLAMIAAMSPGGAAAAAAAAANAKARPSPSPADTVATDDSFRQGEIRTPGQSVHGPGGGGGERRSVHGSSSLAALGRVQSAARLERSQSVRAGGAFDARWGSLTSSPGGVSGFKRAGGSDESPRGKATRGFSWHGGQQIGEALARTSTSFAAAAVTTADDNKFRAMPPTTAFPWDVPATDPMSLEGAVAAGDGLGGDVDGDRAAGRGGTAALAALQTAAPSDAQSEETMSAVDGRRAAAVASGRDAPPDPGVIFKLLVGEDVFRFRVLGEPVTLETLVARVREVLRCPARAVRLKYRDDENDWCIVGSDKDLCEALTVAKSSHVSLKLVAEDGAAFPSACAGGIRQRAPASDRSAARARDAAGKAFVVKAHFGEDVVRLKLEPGMNVADLLSRLQNSIDVEPTRLRLKYKDDVGELCALVGDADLDECRAVFAHTGTMRLYAVG